MPQGHLQVKEIRAVEAVRDTRVHQENGLGSQSPETGAQAPMIETEKKETTMTKVERTSILDMIVPGPQISQDMPVHYTSAILTFVSTRRLIKYTISVLMNRGSTISKQSGIATPATKSFYLQS